MSNVETRSPRGFTLLEVVLALSVLAVGLMAFYVTLSRAMLLSETNKQIKIALFEAQSIVEEIQGVPFDEVMDPDYPSATQPNPRYRHLQYVEDWRLYGETAPGNRIANPPRLEDEKVRVWYGKELDTSDVSVMGISDPVVINPDGTVVVQHAARLNVAKPLNIVPGSQNVALLDVDYTKVPAHTVPERCRPANNSPLNDEFITPEPLYVTVEVTWNGPTRTPMAQRITFVRSR